MAVLYISTKVLKRDTPLGSAVDDNIIHPQIRVAQDRYILPALGTRLDNKLKDLIEDDEIGLAGNESYKKLLDEYIIPCLTQFVFIEVAYVLRVRFSNNTMVTPSSEQGQSASMQDIKMILNRTEDIAMFYRQRLIEYLVHNETLYPEYNKATNEELHSSTRNYFQNLNVYERGVLDNQTRAFISGLGYD